MASLRQLTDGAAAPAFRNDVLHDMVHEATRRPVGRGRRPRALHVATCTSRWGTPPP